MVFSLAFLMVVSGLQAGGGALGSKGQDSFKGAREFFGRYPDASFSEIYRESLEAFVQVEGAYRAGEYERAWELLEAFWKKYPAGTEVWGAAYTDAMRTSRATGINIGTPSCYYALRMLTECVEWRKSGGKVNEDALTATLSVVLVGKAHGIEAKSRSELEAGEGTETERVLEASLLKDNFGVIRDSLWLFNEYVTASTQGELVVKTWFVEKADLRVPVETRWEGRGFSGPSGAGWGQIWESVSDEVKRTTDWWWVIYPSGVPEQYPDFATAEFITGGMGVGPDGASPCFIIDDRWLTRKPPHIGQGGYSDLERRAYLPQWLQHEFYHHLFRIYPEYGLEKEGHDWFYREKWPEDFEGVLEPDYYAEALKRRFVGSEPSLAVRLLYAPPSPELFEGISVEDLVGEFVHEPEQNGWHRGTIRVEPGEGGQLRWTNSAGASWVLTPEIGEGRLLTGPDCPYYADASGRGREFTVVLKRDGRGRFLPEVVGFNFHGTFYRKL